jgi:hypothetical protein
VESLVDQVGFVVVEVEDSVAVAVVPVPVPALVPALAAAAVDGADMVLAAALIVP